MTSILTISQLNSYIAFKIKDDFRLKGIFVEGEISNFVYYKKSGHFYFTLKDATSSIKAVMFSSNTCNLNFIPENGMNVIVSASVQVYERDGLYQLYVTDIQPSGLGKLYLAYEQLKEKLEKENLFSDEYKKKIPLYPNKLGVITSKSGAALQDIINIVSRRYPLVEILIFPCIVQGKEAVDSITKAINEAGNSACDVLIVGRGGGSFEDLNAFNSECVARAIFNSKIPVISAVGHETDISISDFVADLRAPTPSAAAELAVPDINELKNYLSQYTNKIKALVLKNISEKSDLLKSIYISKEKLTQKIEKNENTFALLNHRMNSAIKNIYTEKESALKNVQLGLSLINPFNVLARGYSIVYDGCEVVKSTTQLQVNKSVKIVLSDGNAEVTVTKITNNGDE